MRDLSVAQEAREHRQRACGERLIDERLLAFESLDSRATRKRVFAGLSVGDLRIQLVHRAQPFCRTPVARVPRLAKHELAARGVVAEIEPIGGTVV